MKHINLFFIALLTMAMVLMPIPRSNAMALTDEITPHRAVYDIDMVSNRAGSQILNVDGEMTYEWHPVCDGWNTQHRFNLVYEYTEVPRVKINSHFSTFESLDGETLSFSSRRKSNNVLLEEHRGHATVHPAVAGKVDYTIPTDLEHTLEPGTILPTQHTAQMIEAIRKNERFFNAVVFDGSDETGPVRVNSFIGKAASAHQDNIGKEVDDKLLASKAYNIRLAFFPLSSDEATPEYEMDMIFHENGIIRQMLIHYDDFSVKQTLKSLKNAGNSCKKQSFNE